MHENEAFGGFCCKLCHWWLEQVEPLEHGDKWCRLPAPSCYIKADVTPPQVPMSAVLERVMNKRRRNTSDATGPHDAPDLPMPTTRADDALVRRRPRPPPDAPGLVSRRPRPPPDAPGPCDAIVDHAAPDLPMHRPPDALVSQKRSLPPPDAPPGPPDAIVNDDAPDLHRPPDAQEDLNILKWRRLLAARRPRPPVVP